MPFRRLHQHLQNILNIMLNFGGDLPQPAMGTPTIDHLYSCPCKEGFYHRCSENTVSPCDKYKIDLISSAAASAHVCL
jgi:hypothetical protein